MKLQNFIFSDFLLETFNLSKGGPKQAIALMKYPFIKCKFFYLPSIYGFE